MLPSHPPTPYQAGAGWLGADRPARQEQDNGRGGGADACDSVGAVMRVSMAEA